MFNLLLDVIDKGTYFFKLKCPAFSENAISYMSVLFYYVPALIIAGTGRLALYDRNIWNFYKTTCVLIHGALLWSITDLIKLEQVDPHACEDASRSRVCYHSSTMALIAALELWRRIMQISFPDKIRMITSKVLTWDSIVWNLLLNTLLVFGTCYGLVYLHVNTLMEVIFGVVIGITDAVMLSSILFFVIIPNIQSRLFSYILWICYIKPETINQINEKIRSTSTNFSRNVQTFT